MGGIQQLLPVVWRQEKTSFSFHVQSSVSGGWASQVTGPAVCSRGKLQKAYRTQQSHAKALDNHLSRFTVSGAVNRSQKTKMASVVD